MSDEDPVDTEKKNEVKESVIRQMTRLALEYGAVNLSQGFPNEAPPRKVQWALAHAVLVGQPTETTTTTASTTSSASTRGDNDGDDDPNASDHHHKSLLRTLSSSLTSSSDLLESNRSNVVVLEKNDTVEEEEDDLDRNNPEEDQLNQYSPPMGRLDLRVALAEQYYQRLYNYQAVDPENITITLGATEAVACALRSIGRPGDKVVIFEPFHELYPNQCRLFYLEPVYVTLRPPPPTLSLPLPPQTSKTPQQQPQPWTFDAVELQEALSTAKILLLNTPHNPTGKVFTHSELQFIVDLCLQYNVYIVTDEIYEHMCFSSSFSSQQQEGEPLSSSPPLQHIIIPQEFPHVAHLTLVCNSMGKSASATGWRLGWCLHPPSLRSTYRGIHDQLTVMSPHPMQYACLTYLSLPLHYFQHELRAKYEPRVRLLAATLHDVGFTVWMPQGAYYLFCQYTSVPQLAQFENHPMDAALYLLQTVGVACVPGDNFYGKAIQEQGSLYLRFAACRSMKDLKEACFRLKKWAGL
jgi:aspartate/methionine/tyrosine aminotransferase